MVFFGHFAAAAAAGDIFKSRPTNTIEREHQRRNKSKQQTETQDRGTEKGREGHKHAKREMRKQK